MIVPVDGETAPEELLRAVHLVEDEVDAVRGGPRRTTEEAIASYRNPGTARRLRWLATNDDQPAGLAALSLYGGSLSIGYVLVRERFRRRGIGRTLFATLVEQARAEGIGAFFGEHATAAGAAFARSVGAVDDQRHVVSLLDLRRAELPEPQPPLGVELRSWAGAAPEELVASLVHARNAMADTPMPGALEPPTWTIERQRADEVVTRNAEHNTAMLAVNRKLGFVPTVTLTSAVVTL